MKLDKLDLAIIQTIALCRLPELASRLVDEEKIPPRTFQHRMKRLRDNGLVDRNDQLTELGKDAVSRVGSLREKGRLVSSHSFWYRCRILHKPHDSHLKGWKCFRLREWQNQYLLRNREFLLRALGDTLVIHIGPVAGVGPIENAGEAFKRALSLVRRLEEEGWRLGDVMESKPSEHVLEPLKPVAEWVYARHGPVDLVDVLVDNSKKDGGEFEAKGVETAHQFFSDLAKFSTFKRSTEERLKRLEKEIEK